MKVSTLARQLQIKTDTVRYYTRIHLLKPLKDANGYYHYSEKDSNRLRFILRAKQLGFSLEDIQTLITIADSGETPCPTARKIITDNIEQLEQSIRESIQLFKHMKKAIRQWDTMPDASPHGETICSLIENWDKSGSHKHGAVDSPEHKEKKNHEHA